MSTTFGKPHFVWLGAGEAADTQLLEQFLKQYPQGQITLVEARDNAVVKLQQRYADAINYSVNSAVLAIQTGKSNFYTLNLPEFSSLQQPTGLVSLFPGVAVQKIEPVDTLAVAKYIAGLSIEAEQPNHLYIDIPAQVGSIVRQLVTDEQLHFFSELHISAGLEALYEEAEKRAYIEGLLTEQGYEVVSTDNADPDIPVISFKLNPLWQRLDVAQQRLSEALELNVKLAELHRAEKIALVVKVDELKQQLDNTKAAATKQLDELKKETENSIKELKAVLAEAQSKVVTTSKQLAETTQALNTANSKIEAHLAIGPLEQILEEKLQQMFTTQSQEINKAVGNLKNHVTAGLGNTAKQLESFHGIQNYIERGVKPLSFHGWPISPDIGLYITGLIDANNYDVIIEFGSGTSTVLMAKALQAKQRNMPVRTVIEKAESKQNQVVLSDTGHKDLPARIITFEHNALYHEKTQQALKANDVDYLVDLVHAPLVDYQYKDGTQYLYYSCNDKLHELKNAFKGRKANILVLVDGPPGATNKNARFPALPYLLNALPGHEYTMIMDDYNRTEEKEIIECWLKICKERCLCPVLEEVTSEKGLAVIKFK